MVTDRDMWAEAHFGKAKLGDKRRTQRLVRLARQFAAVPGGTITDVFPDWAEMKAAYRLLDGDEVSHGSVCAGSFEQVQSIRRSPGVYLMIEDTTAASFPMREAAVGLGPVGEDYTHGFRLHSTLAVRWQGQLRAPRRPGTPLVDQEINVVEVREIEAPVDADPVHWILLTDLPTDTLPELWKVVAIYRRRWLIEEFHKALKSGVGLEKSQLAEARKLMALAGILSIVACFLVGLKFHARSDNALPLDETQVDHATRVILEKKVGRPKEGWTYQTILVAIARLGGYIGRRSDGPPGWQTIWRGWQRLLLPVEGFRLASDG